LNDGRSDLHLAAAHLPAAVQQAAGAVMALLDPWAN